MIPQNIILQRMLVLKYYLMPRLPDYESQKMWRELALEETFEEILSQEPSGREVDYPKEDVLQVSSWNIQFGLHIDDITRAIIQNNDLKNSDIVALQEVTRNNKRAVYRDIVEELATATGFGYAYGRSYLGLNGDGYTSEVGNMILSRHSINEPSILMLSPGVDVYKLSRGKIVGGRIAISGRIAKNGKYFAVYCTHLEAFTNPHHRAKQLAEIIDDADKRYPSLPVVIAGDFNFGPLEPISSNGYHDFYDPFKDKRQSTSNTHLGRLLKLRLDRIISRDLELIDSKIHRDLPFSDHFPITAIYNSR